MLDSKKLEEVNTRIKNYLSDGVIRTKENVKDVDFFLINAKNSLESAKLLFSVSDSEDLQEKTGFMKFNGYLWVINSSYYSIFYMARAMIENSGIKLKSDLSIHALAFDVLVHYFYLNGKLEKNLVQIFLEAKEETAELLGKNVADELIESYFHEKGKHGEFTYETGSFAMKNKAKTSLERADKFNKEIRKIIHSSYS